MKRKIIVGAVAALAVAGGGAAIASTQLGAPPAEESEAIVNDAAKELGVEPSKLRDALKTALKNRVDAAVEAGRLSKERGDELKARIDAADTPILFGGGPRHFGRFAHFGDLSTAASYLGVTGDELRSDLAAGKTLAQVARDKGKSVDGLVDALVGAARERLDEAVSAGRLTEAQRDSVVADLRERMTAFVNNARPKLGHGGFRGGGFFGADRFGGPRLHEDRMFLPPPFS